MGASWAVPGVWPPVTIGERRFMNGGMRTVAHADLAHGYERLVIVAPAARILEAHRAGVDPEAGRMHLGVEPGLIPIDAGNRRRQP